VFVTVMRIRLGGVRGERGVL